MPTVYVSGNLKVDVALPKDDDHEFTYGEWTDKKLAKERVKYEKPNLGISLEIANEEDPICPFVIPIFETDVYDGNFAVTQNDRVFSFEFSAKAKPSVHKLTKGQIDAGKRPKLTSVSINGQDYSLNEPMDIDFVIQSKKI